MRIREFQCELWLPVPPEDIFPFFADARNLDAITPSWLKFRVVTPEPIEIKAGAMIDYRLRVHGLPLRWRTLISEWQPPHRFVDEQLRGPYRRWIHTHTFEAHGGGTLARDVVRRSIRFHRSPFLCAARHPDDFRVPAGNAAKEIRRRSARLRT